MLTRAVRRRQALRDVQHVAGRIQLPWLCPALWSTHSTHTRSNHRPITSPARRHRAHSVAPLSTNARKHAAAAPAIDFLESHRVYDTFDRNSRDRPVKPSRISPSLDLSRILMIDTTSKADTQYIDAQGKRNWTRGHTNEVEATFEACLQLQQWDRSLEILGQLRSVYDNDTPKLQELYNKALSAMVFDHIWHGSTQNVSRINSWVEKTLKTAQIPPDAETFALKIKAAMSSLSGRRRDRTVRRYWDLAKEHNVNWEVTSLRHILSDSDIGKLSEIALPQLEFEPLEEEGEEGGLEKIEIQDDLISQRPLPDVRETDQKGLGLTSLRSSLASFKHKLSPEQAAEMKLLDPAAYDAVLKERQLKLERDFLETALTRWRTENAKMAQMGINGNLAGAKIGALMWKWHQALEDALRTELEEIDKAEQAQKKTSEQRMRMEYGPFLRLLEPKLLSALASTSIVQWASKNGIRDDIKLASLVILVGRAVEAEVESRNKQRRVALTQRIAQEQRKKGTQSGSTEELSATKELEHLKSVPRMRWTSALHAKVGSVLCERFFEVAKMPLSDGKNAVIADAHNRPAFSRQHIVMQGRLIGVIRMHPDLAAMLVREPVADLIAKQLPMVCEPKVWTNFDEGGYYETRTEALRVKHGDPNQREYAEAAAERGDLKQVFRGLDVLGQTGWRVNKDVFNVMLEAWNSGEAVANLAPLNFKHEEPQKPTTDASPREKYAYYQALHQFNNEKGGLHSERCFQNFQMEIAKAYLDDTFYLPHNMDFRGRAYPIPPYLNQMGADNARALLLFDKGRELGQDGLKWLKVQLANVYGYDKASLDDRAQFAMDHIEDIRDSVASPLNGRRWWLQAEDPWQCLAACHEITKALDSGNPETFVSHLPVHQDGTCNGLQHYAALGGDIAGARQVNLEPGDRPADVYTGVCELVRASIHRDAGEGSQLAKELDGKIVRKIVKQTVMTNVYGVTFIGAIRQVRRQIEELLPELPKSLQQKAATYIARNIFKGLGTLFEGAHNIQYWLGDCATRITSSISPAQLEKFAAAKKARASSDRQPQEASSDKTEKVRDNIIEGSHFRSSVVWTTPLQLPVIQPYYNTQTQTVQTHLSKIILKEPKVDDPVDKRKQLQALPPNFIHSLDASHMMLSAIAAADRGLSFSAVHDSFWTHAADINIMNEVLREAFINMHSEDIIGRLAEEFKIRYKGHLYLAKIPAGTVPGRAIREYRANLQNQVKAKSKGNKPHGGTNENRDMAKRLQFEEILLEAKRQELLSSSEPGRRQKGEKMVTAASLFEKYDGEKYLSSMVSLGETAVHKQTDPDDSPTGKVLEKALEHGQKDEVQDVNMEATLRPLVEEQEGGESRTEKMRKPKRREVGSNKKDVIWVWLPLTFKEVPKKGEWDIKRLRESTYFFS